MNFLEAMVEAARSVLESRKAAPFKNGFRVRLRFLMDRFAKSERSFVDLEIGGLEVRISGVDFQKPIDSKELTICVHGIEKFEEAERLGWILRDAVSVYSAVRRNGIDLGDNISRSMMFNGFREGVEELSGAKIRPNIHGLDVFEEDGTVIHFQFGAEMTVSSPAEKLVPSIDGSFDWVSNLPAPILMAARLLNSADFSHVPIAKLSLSMAALEALSPEKPHSDKTRDQLTKLSELVELNHEITNDDEKRSVIAQIRNIRDFGLGSATRIRLMLREKGLGAHSTEISQIARVRGKLLHGNYVELTKQEDAAERLRQIAQFVLDRFLSENGVDVELMRS